jgi:hypothetical protein
MESLSDSSILVLIQMGNRLGIKQLYDKYKNKLLFAIREMLPGVNQELADELVLHAVIKAWIDRGNLPPAEFFFSWLVEGIAEEIEALESDISKVSFD